MRKYQSEILELGMIYPESGELLRSFSIFGPEKHASSSQIFPLTIKSAYIS